MKPGERDHGVLHKKWACSRLAPKFGQGLCLWLPKGARVPLVLLEDFLRQELLRRGYEPVFSPHLGRVELYETSGHFPLLSRQSVPATVCRASGWFGRRLDCTLAVARRATG